MLLLDSGAVVALRGAGAPLPCEAAGHDHDHDEDADDNEHDDAAAAAGVCGGVKGVFRNAAEAVLDAQRLHCGGGRLEGRVAFRRAPMDARHKLQ